MYEVRSSALLLDCCYHVMRKYYDIVISLFERLRMMGNSGKNGSKQKTKKKKNALCPTSSRNDEFEKMAIQPIIP